MSESGILLGTHNSDDMSVKIIQYPDNTVIMIWENHAVMEFDAIATYAALKRINQQTDNETRTGLTAAGINLLKMLDMFL